MSEDIKEDGQQVTNADGSITYQYDYEWELTEFAPQLQTQDNTLTIESKLTNDQGFSATWTTLYNYTGTLPVTDWDALDEDEVSATYTGSFGAFTATPSFADGYMVVTFNGEMTTMDGRVFKSLNMVIKFNQQGLPVFLEGTALLDGTQVTLDMSLFKPQEKHDSWTDRRGIEHEEVCVDNIDRSGYCEETTTKGTELSHTWVANAGDYQGRTTGTIVRVLSCVCSCGAM